MPIIKSNLAEKDKHGGVIAAELALVSATLLMVPFARQPGPYTPGLVSLTSAVVLLADLATSYLLAVSFSIEGRRSLLILTGAYFYSGIMALFNLLAFPSAIVSGGPVLPVGLQTALWIFLLWIGLFPVVCCLSVLVERFGPTDPRPSHGRRQDIVAAMVVTGLVTCAALAISLGLVTWLPTLINPDGAWIPMGPLSALAIYGIPIFSWLVSALTVCLILTAGTSIHQVFGWLALALSAIMCSSFLAWLSGSRFTLGWMAARIGWMTANATVILYFVCQYERHLRRLVQLLSSESERQKCELRATEATLAAIVSSTSEAVLTKTLDGTITSWNAAAERLLGYKAPEIIGRPVHKLIPQPRLKEEETILARVAAGQRIENYDSERVHQDGRLIEVALTVSPLSVGGRLIGASSILHDITERKRREEHNFLLLREVNHRSKNLLAVVEAIAHQTARSSTPDFLTSFTDRITALAASHDLLVESQWLGVDLRDLIGAELSRFRELPDARLGIDGPPLCLTAQAAQTLGMALHELATNASKYGAWSNATGQIAVTWRHGQRDGIARVILTWEEIGGPKVAPPAHKGFGTVLICDAPKSTLKAEVQLRYEPLGLFWRLDAPAGAMLERNIPSA